MKGRVLAALADDNIDVAQFSAIGYEAVFAKRQISYAQRATRCAGLEAVLIHKPDDEIGMAQFSAMG
jgi:hypothetical protein